MQIYRARADGATTRQRHFRFPKTREQRSKRQHRRPHRLHQLIRRLEKFDVCGGDFVGAELRRQNCGADVFKQPALSDDVADVWNIVQGNCFGREQRRGHAGQRRIFGAAD